VSRVRVTVSRRSRLSSAAGSVRVDAEWVVSEHSTDHNRQQNEGDYDVGPHDLILIQPVHEDRDNKARFDRSDNERSNDIPLAHVNLRCEHSNNGEEKERAKNLGE
jgi:hypothetical protein